MKKLLLSSLFCIAMVFGYSQNYSINFNSAKQNSSTPNGIEISKSTDKKLSFSVSYSGIDALQVTSPEGNFSQLQLQGSYRSGEVGTPQLPATRKIIEVPAGAEVSINVKNFNESTYNLADFGIDRISPVQPSYPKSIDPSKVEFIYNVDAYNNDAFIQKEIAGVKKLGAMRGMQLAQVEINPIAYNPVQNTIKVYNNIEVEVTFKNVDKLAHQSNVAKNYSPYFEPVFNTILNHKTLNSKYDDYPDHTKYPVKYLIVTDPDFEEDLTDFVDWKIKKGFEVTMVTTDDIGSSSTDIKTWIHNQYDNATATDPAPTFFLLVGDVDQVPASQVGDETSKQTDLYYACMDGSSDIFPDMYYGRLSAQNTTQLNNMLDKILYYEKYEFEDPSYLNDLTLIAGADGTWNPRVGQPTINYGTENYFNTDNGFSTINTYLSSYTGCYAQDNFKVSLINYTAHCGETSWSDPHLSISDVNGLENANKYPLAIGNCCLAADFGTSECIGETWMRKANGGAVAYIGSSPSSYWWEDYYWSVGAHSPVYNQHPSFEGSSIGAYDAPFVTDYLCVDALIYVGNLAVAEAHDENYETSINLQYYWEAYNCLSDPSLFIYLGEGIVNEVSHLPTVPIGVTEYEVSAEPGSYVAITKDGMIHGTALVPESGIVTVELVPITSGGNVDIVVTRSQYQPYTMQVPAAALEGPYLAVDEFTINDGNDGEAQYGEAFNLDLVLKNVGTEVASGVTISITSTDEYVESLTNNTNITCNDIAIDGNAAVTGSFDVILSNNTPNGHTIAFDIVINDDYTSETKQQYESTKSIVVLAPELILESIAYNDDFEGNNNNGILDAGETGEVIFTISNSGDAEIDNLEATLSSFSDYLTFNNSEATIGTLVVDASTEITYNITVSETTPLEELIPVNISLTNDTYEVEIESELIIGEIPVFIMGEDADIITCNAIFKDQGGDEDYDDDLNIVQTFYPSSEIAKIRVEFLEFNVESNYDYLYIYNGTEDIEANLIGQFDGDDFTAIGDNGVITSESTDGALTFKFTSDGSVTRTGWVAKVQCIELGALNSAIFTIVDDAYNAVEGATITIGTEDQLTDSEGHASFEMEFGTYEYTVSKTNYFTSTGEFDITIEDVYVMEQIILDANLLTITVVDENENGIADATIVINNDSILTNNAGIASIGLLAGTYEYAVSAYGFDDKEGSIEIVDADIEETIAMVSNMAMITFNVTENGLPVDSAMISIDDHVYYTDSIGTARMEMGYCELVYSVWKQGYSEIVDTVEFSDELVIDVDLTISGIEELNNAAFSVYPNPTNGEIIISGVDIQTLSVTHISGQQVYYSENNALKNTVNLSDFNAGVYFVNITDKNGEAFTYKVTLLK